MTAGDNSLRGTRAGRTNDDGRRTSGDWKKLDIDGALVVSEGDQL